MNLVNLYIKNKKNDYLQGTNVLSQEINLLYIEIDIYFFVIFKNVLISH